jgi:hypothetical protein
LFRIERAIISSLKRFLSMQDILRTNYLRIFLSASVAFLVIACKKDSSGSGGNATVNGTWKFTGMSAITQAIAQYSDGITDFKTINNSSYKSTGNSGTVNITGSTMAGIGVTYSIADTAFATDYEDNQLVDTFSTLFSFNFPPTNSTADYTQINQDSIYFTGQGIFGTPGVSSTSATGAKLVLNGDILTMTSSVAKDTVINEGGFPITQHETATVVATMQRQ